MNTLECHECGGPVSRTVCIGGFDDVGEMMDNLFCGYGMYPESDYLREEDVPAETHCSDCGYPTCMNCMHFCERGNCRHADEDIGNREGYCGDCVNKHFHICKMHKHCTKIVYCGEHAPSCVHCNAPVCHMCQAFTELQCDRDLGDAAHLVCSSCAAVCNSCSYITCRQCMGRCTQCNGRFCNECVLLCSTCNRLCHCDVNTCAVCGSAVCGSCTEEHSCLYQVSGCGDTQQGYAWRTNPSSTTSSGTSFYAIQHVMLGANRALLFGNPTTPLPYPDPRCGLRTAKDRSIWSPRPQVLDMSGRKLLLSAIDTTGHKPSPKYGNLVLGYLDNTVYVLNPGLPAYVAFESRGQQQDKGPLIHKLDVRSWRWSSVPVTLPDSGRAAGHSSSSISDVECCVACAGKFYMFKSCDSQSPQQWVYCLDPSQRPLVIHPVQVTGPLPQRSGTIGRQQHLAATVLEDGRVFILHSSRSSYFFNPATCSTSQGPPLPLMPEHWRQLVYSTECLDRWSRTSIVSVTAMGPNHVVALVSSSFRKPSEFFRLDLTNNTWMHLDGAACRVQGRCAVLPANPGNRLVVLGGIECKADSSESDKAAATAFIVGPVISTADTQQAAKRQRHGGSTTSSAMTTEGPSRYPARRCNRVGRCNNFRVRSCDVAIQEAGCSSDDELY